MSPHLRGCQASEENDLRTSSSLVDNAARNEETQANVEEHERRRGVGEPQHAHGVHPREGRMALRPGRRAIASDASDTAAVNKGRPRIRLLSGARLVPKSGGCPPCRASATGARCGALQAVEHRHLVVILLPICGQGRAEATTVALMVQCSRHVTHQQWRSFSPTSRPTI